MRITFHGAAQQVTGSCHLLDTGKHKILLDCGLVQGSFKDEQNNRDEFQFDPKSIDAVVLSHAHIDHSGRLPLLIKRGYSGPIFTHEACRDLCAIMLKDSAYLNERETEWENRKRERKGLPLLEPLYDQADAEATISRFETMQYQHSKEILPDVQLDFFDAGHILGSSIVKLCIKQNQQTKTIVFSGDLGHGQSQILKTPTLLHNADLVIMESTYGERLHKPYADTLKELDEILQAAMKSAGNIIIPAFAVGRSQELLYLFAQHFHDWKLEQRHIFLDSPMAIEATQVYMRHSALYQAKAAEFWQVESLNEKLPNLHFCQTAAESMALNKIHSGAIIIAASGMCTGGRIKHHLKHNVWRRNNHIIISGFQARGTTGRALVDNAKSIRLWGETIQVNAQVHTLGGFSAHADRDGLSRWYQNFEKGTPLILVHGENGAMRALSEEIETRTGVQARIPELNQSIAF